MPGQLKVTIGQHSDKGRRDANQDFHGALQPEQPLLGLKGIAVALADGIGSSEVSHVASESAVKAMMTDYYCTSPSWTVKTSARRVIAATNSWLHAQSRRSRHRYDMDKGYVCTLSVIVLKGASAHLFHVGDCRIYRLAGRSLEQLTIDHRVAASSEQHYLGRALGADREVEIDHLSLGIEAGDVFVLATDGVHEYVPPRAMAAAIAASAHDLDAAARAIVAEAFAGGSPDNLTVQLVRVEEVPGGDAAEMLGQSAELPLPPPLAARMSVDGYTILRPLHESHRSHVLLARDDESGALVALKVPSTDMREDEAHLRRFMLEDWVAGRIDSPHVLRPVPPTRRRSFLYLATEYVDGQTLTQWMTDHPRPDLETARGLIEQIARGLRAFHRREMLHQDLRPENVLVDRNGTVRIIDFGSVRIAGVAEARPAAPEDILGTAQYTAPEYFLGEGGTTRSDIFSLGVIAYQMLTGRLPYGAAIARTRTRAQQRRLSYRSALDEAGSIPAWVDGALAKAVAIDPARRYEALSQFVEDLRRPNPDLVRRTPLIERNPTLVWKGVSLVLAAIVVVLLYREAARAPRSPPPQSISSTSSPPP